MDKPRTGPSHGLNGTRPASPPVSLGNRPNAFWHWNAAATSLPPPTGASEHLTFQQAIPGRPQDVRRALTRIVRALAAQGLSGEGCLRAEVVLAEILNNVVEHGYGDGAPGSLTVRIERSEAGFRFRVQDDGAPMPNRAIPLGRRHDLSVGLKNLPEGGFGWCLIRELTAELRYERQHGRNTLSFRLSDRVEI